MTGLLARGWAWSCEVFSRSGLSCICGLVQGGGCAAGYDPGSPWEEVKGEVLEADDENPALSCGKGVLLHSLIYLGCC